MRAHVVDRVKLLLGRAAIPGYLLFALSLIGLWSNVEFAIGKIRALAGYVPPWLFMLAGLAWLGWLVARPPVSLDRVQAMRRLLYEAAASCRTLRRTERETIESVGPFVRMDLNLQQFLTMGFAHHVRRDFDSMRNDEREKWSEAGRTFLTELFYADFLEHLAQRLRSDDLDPGFHIPQTYKQFEDADRWTPNIRPLPQGTIVGTRSAG